MEMRRKSLIRKVGASALALSLTMASACPVKTTEAWFFASKKDQIDANIENVKKEVELKAWRGGDITSVQERLLEGEKFNRTLLGYADKFIPVLMFSFIFSNFSQTIGHIKNIYASVSNVVSNWIYKMTAKGINVNKYKQLLEKIETRLRTELVGQDEAIDKILNVITGHFEAMIEAKSQGKKYEKGLVLYFIGSPATGKSTVMRIIEEEMGLRSYVGRMSDAVEDKGNNANTVVARLTKPVIQDNGQVKVSVDTPFTKCLKSKIATLYCIDEIDKMRTLDSILRKSDLKNSSGKIVSGSLDEMVRNFGDTGQINGINASGSVLIATSNETEDDMKQLEDSLYNRYQNCIVKFKDLTAADYREIIKRQTSSIKEFYKRKFNVDIEWSEQALDYFAQKFESENTGARAVDSLLNNVRCTLKGHRDKNFNFDVRKNNFKDNGRKLILDCDKNSKKLFVAEEINRSK